MAAIGAERRERLRARLEADGVIRLEESAAELGVSTMTVRRDLEALEAEGVVVRVRGGAVAPVRAQTFAERERVDDAAKSEIARKALHLVPTSGTVALDASSTTGHLLAAVRGAEGLLVATNSAHNHARARAIRGVRAVLLGGELEPETDSYVGPVACAAAGLMNYDRFFTSAAALDERGTSETSLEEAQVKRVLVRSAGATVLLADSGKLERRAAAHALDWDAVSTVVTELDPADARLDWLRPHVDLL
jgi:DeoR family transcriptional regulator, fructose operon transcriptional repressor